MKITILAKFKGKSAFERYEWIGYQKDITYTLTVSEHGEQYKFIIYRAEVKFGEYTGTAADAGVFAYIDMKTFLEDWEITDKYLMLMKLFF